MQEGAGGCAHLYAVAVSCDGEDIQCFHWRLCLAFRGAEGCEVVVAYQVPGSFVHRGCVEFGGNLPGKAPVEGQGAAPVYDAIEVMARGRVEAGVECVSCGFSCKDCDRVWAQMGIERLLHAEGIERPCDVCVCNLPGGVDAGVSATCRGDGHFFSGEFQDRLFDGGLDRGAILLALPADEGPAVVLDREFPAWHV